MPAHRWFNFAATKYTMESRCMECGALRERRFRKPVYHPFWGRSDFDDKGGVLWRPGQWPWAWVDEEPECGEEPSPGGPVRFRDYINTLEFFSSDYRRRL